MSRFLSRVGSATLVAILVSLPIFARAADPVIGILTDYGSDGPYVAQVKGAILTIAPAARILDLVRTVTPFNVSEGAYLLDQAAEDFPPGTIFITVVDPQLETDVDPILVQTAKGKFFIGRNNGVFTTVLNREGFSGAWKLDKPEFFRAGTSVSSTFRSRDIFGPIAAHLVAGGSPEKLGTPLPQKSLVLLPEPSSLGGILSTEVLYIDHFGNVILDLRDDSDRAAKLKEGNLVKISIGKESYSAPLVKTYGDVAKGRLLLLYSGSGLLEVSMNQGSAAKLLKVELGTAIFLKP